MADQPTDSSSSAPPSPTPFSRFETWKEYQAVAMHFNDLLLRLRSQSLAAVAAFSAVAGLVIRAGVDAELRWGTLAGVFLLLMMFWIAIWVLDLRYYNRLLIGAVDALLEIEHQSSQTASVDQLALSTRIEATVGGSQTPTGRLARENARWFFYGLVFLTLFGGFMWSLYSAGALNRIGAVFSTSSGWLDSGPLPQRDPQSGITFNSTALFADIPLPPIEQFSARIKFVPALAADQAADRVAGYGAEVRIASLDKKTVPERYLQRQTLQAPGGPVTIEPLEQVTYIVQLTIELFDGDGFRIGEVTGPQHAIVSGTANVLQELTTPALSAAVASRVEGFKPRLRILRCESCRSN